MVNRPPLTSPVHRWLLIAATMMAMMVAGMTMVTFFDRHNESDSPVIVIVGFACGVALSAASYMIGCVVGWFNGHEAGSRGADVRDGYMEP